jgi:hypothetical protein
MISTNNIRAFVDDTGSDPNEMAFNLCCWVSDADGWDRFSEDWYRELQKRPSIDYFKHNEAKGLKKQFKGWKRPAADKKIFALAKIIARHKNYGMITGAENKLFKVLLNRAAAAPQQFRSVMHVSRPYDFCFHSIIAMVLQHQVNLADGRTVDFIFDRGDRAFFECNKIYEEWREFQALPAMKAIAGVATQGDDKTIMPLQAADLLAGQLSANLKYRKTEKPFDLLLADGRVRFNIAWLSRMIERAKRKT